LRGLFGGAFPANQNLHRRVNFAMQLDDDVVISDFLDRLSKTYSASFNFITLFLKGCHNIHRRYRTVENSMLAGAPFENQLDAIESVGLSLGGGALPGLALFQHAALFDDHSFVARRSFNSQSLRQQVVSAVSHPHSHDLSAMAQVVNVLA